MSRLESLKMFLQDRLTAAAEEILAAVEGLLAEYRDELVRAKELEIGRLRLQLLRAEPGPDRCVGAQVLQDLQQLQPPAPAAAPEEAPCEGQEDGDSGMELPEASEVKKEQQRSREFWMNPDSEQLQVLDSDMKSFMCPGSSLKNLQEAADLQHLQSFQQNHSGDESRDKAYTCSVCEKRFSNCSHLAAHIRTHTGERPYRCDICRKSFITTSALNRHQTIHTEGKHFACSCCGKTFKWMESLGRHMRSVHKKDAVHE
ncbi:zinc finger and SCAN domain-containing protein 2-like [Acanthochromis polyacanthus]|uniref:Zinc finger and SCAN domain-containing protein 2-like n=1 Tax=Acanthochromis polyacanthus TaxID=80966 RepID=A0A3Q1HJQ5_9TELE|nr:zinc finger and SCAN domain-containing protein 2-like [Acanthochromis polyacanthus]